GCGVPEAALPEPFSSRSISINGDSISADSSVLSETEILNSSHLPPSFKRHFHQKAAATEMEKTDILSSVKSACEVNGEMDGEVEELRSLPGSSSVASGSESTPLKPLVGTDSVIVETPVQSTQWDRFRQLDQCLPVKMRPRRQQAKRASNPLRLLRNH
ncbi:UNVERIFIED_CONTAM: hypothetical protein Slati_3567100, partial [Sesamum latifolium]